MARSRSGPSPAPANAARRRQEDEALADELLADPKERAEHLMLLDLGRNDVGRVSKLGTVEVTDQFFIERYSHVMHIVSNVTGELDTDRYDALDALGAGFPAGTVSGAPKVRAMEIIDELEKTSAASMPAAWAISTPMARSTPALCCAPPSSKMA
jgi:anthranilate/para-aminobenzoate synthase component I